MGVIVVISQTGSIIKLCTVSPRYCDLWRRIIEKIGKVACKLDFPTISHLHIVFHVSRLNKSLLD